MDKPMLLTLLCFAASMQTGKGLECYTCVYMPGGADTCLTKPQDIGGIFQATMDCTHGDDICCTIHKIVQNDEDKTVTSFNRGCQANCNPRDLFKETPHEDTTTYQTFCSTPLCNVGPGDAPLSEIDDGDEGDNMIKNIPGIPGAAVSNESRSIIIALMQVATFLVLFNVIH